MKAQAKSSELPEYASPLLCSNADTRWTKELHNITDGDELYEQSLATTLLSMKDLIQQLTHKKID